MNAWKKLKMEKQERIVIKKEKKDGREKKEGRTLR